MKTLLTKIAAYGWRWFHGGNTLERQIREYGLSLVIAAGAFLMVVSGMGLERIVKQDITAQFEQILDLQQAMINDWFSNQMLQLRNIAALPDVRRGSPAEIARVLNNFSPGQGDFVELGYANRKGVIEATSSVATGTSVADRDYFQYSIVGESSTSDIIQGRVSGQPVVVFSVPVYDYDNKIKGVMIGGVRLESISKLVEKARLGLTGETYLVDSRGTMLTESRFAPELIRGGMVDSTARLTLKVGTEGFQRALAHHDGPAIYTGYLGREVLGTHRRLNNGKWIIMGEAATSEIFRPVYRILAVMGGGFIFMVLAVSPLAFVYARRIRAPIEFLIEQARRIRQEDYREATGMAALDAAPAELRELYTAFDQTARTIREHIQQLERKNLALAHNEAKIRALFNTFPDLVFEVDEQGLILDVWGGNNPHIPSDEASQRGRNIADPLSPEPGRQLLERIGRVHLTGQPESAELRIEILGEQRFTEARIVPCDNGHILVIVRDFTLRREWEDRMLYLSSRDALTGLYNRRTFETRIARIKKQGAAGVGVIICDVNDLKAANDDLGHIAGDALLVAAANTLKECFREEDMIARIGGDEFAVLLAPCTEAVLQEAYQRIKKAVAAYNRSQSACSLGMAVGYAVSHDPDADIMAVFQLADDNMYRDKRAKLPDDNSGC